MVIEKLSFEEIMKYWRGITTLEAEERQLRILEASFPHMGTKEKEEIVKEARNLSFKNASNEKIIKIESFADLGKYL